MLKPILILPEGCRLTLRIVRLFLLRAKNVLSTTIFPRCMYDAFPPLGIVIYYRLDQVSVTCIICSVGPDGTIFTYGYEISESRSFQIWYALCNRNREVKPGQARGMVLTNLSIKAGIQLLRNCLNHMSYVRMYHLIKMSLAFCIGTWSDWSSLTYHCSNWLQVLWSNEGSTNN